MKTAICTISTQSHIFKSLALRKSVSPFFDGDFFCLVTDFDEVLPIDDSIHWNRTIELQEQGAVKILEKYKADQLRWALKPTYLKFLLKQGYDQVIYVDNDVFFYSDPTFLFDLLRDHSFLLTPHFYSSDPSENQNWLEANFRVGLYNAGFIGVSQKGISILDWWENCCVYNVKKSYWRGLFDDQKYLDLVPVLFDDVKIVKHKGCNLAGWNYRNYSYKREKDQCVLVNNEPLVFIHFAALSFTEFSNPSNIFFPEFQKYLTALKKENSSFEWKATRWEKRNIRSFFYYLRWRFVRLFES